MMMRRRKNKKGNHHSEKEEGEVCLTMHQPWASLLVYGIKRVEGRSWPAPFTGRLWIHAASKVPGADTVRAMENFYREIYAVDGVTDLKFPEHYPVSKLVGCVEVVGCVRGEELACWKAVPQGVRLEALTNFCWLCQHPQKLLDPLKMRGDQGVYNLEKKISEAAVGGLVPVVSPLLVKFPLPNPGDYYSLRPGSLHVDKSNSEMSEFEKSSSLVGAIAGAKAAAMQYSKRNHSSPRDTLARKDIIQSVIPDKLSSISLEENMRTTDVEINDKTGSQRRLVCLEKHKQLESNSSNSISQEENVRTTDAEIDAKPGWQSRFVCAEKQRQLKSNSTDRLNKKRVGPSQLFSAALKGIRPV